MTKNVIKDYNPSVHDPLIKDMFSKGLGIVNVAAALDITINELGIWRRKNPQLDSLIIKLQTKYLAHQLEQYHQQLNEEERPDWRILEKLKIFHDYNANHVFVAMPELMETQDMYSRHETLMKYVLNRLISLDTAERISKLLRDNAEIYKMDAIDKRMLAIELALKSIAGYGKDK